MCVSRRSLSKLVDVLVVAVVAMVVAVMVVAVAVVAVAHTRSTQISVGSWT